MIKTESIDYYDLAKAICEKHGYNFISEKGEGANKKVYEIYNNKNNYALKIITSTNPSERILREIKVLSSCDHAGIAKIYYADYIEYNSNSFIYLIEELFTGGNLSKYLIDNTNITKSFIKNFGLQLLRSIKYISDRGFVHRDIKPDNIMFREHDINPVLVDFGTVRDLFDKSLTITWAPHGPGTPYFSSPEQLNNEKTMINWRSDQFSLGVVISFILTGKHPYQKNNEKLYSIDTVQHVASYQSPNPDIINEVNNFGFYCIEKMIQPWPINRFRKVEKLIEKWNQQEV